MIAGLDEAGYGPLLGPLTIGVSAFRRAGPPGPDQVPRPRDLWARLGSAVSKAPSDDATRLVVADSKKVFTRTQRGERRLEQTALAFSRAAGAKAASGREFVAGAPPGLAPTAALLDRHPWYRELPSTLPHASDEAQLAERTQRLGDSLRSAGLSALEAYALVVPAGQWNKSLHQTQNKGASLWAANSALIKRLFEDHGSAGLDLVVDRLGGRARYGHLLSELIPFAEVTVLGESPSDSAYRVEDQDGRRMRIRVVQKGDDRFFTVALASCLAKFARELAMGAFNRFFGSSCPGLRPTAGYVTDARRWLDEVDPTLVAELRQRDLLVRVR